MSAPRRPPDDAGFTLLPVLAVVTAMAAVAATMLALGRAGLDAAGAEAQTAIRHGLVEAGVEIAAYELITAGADPASVDGQEIRFDAGTVRLGVSRPAGRIDLNGSDPRLLAAAYAASGRHELTPAQFAARVADWRDGDDERQAGGAEAADYAALGLAQRPPNHEFLSVDELRWLAGVPPAAARQLAAYFTVDNPEGTVDLSAADGGVLAAVPGLTAADVATILDLQRTPSTANAARLETLAAKTDGLAVAETATPLFDIAITIIRPGRPLEAAEAVIGQDPTGARPYLELVRPDQ